MFSATASRARCSCSIAEATAYTPLGIVGSRSAVAGKPVAGSIVGAQFIKRFVKDGTPWAHLDIAGTAWGSMNRDYVGGSMGSGVGVRLLPGQSSDVLRAR